MNHEIELAREPPVLAPILKDVQIFRPIAGHSSHLVEHLPDGTISLLLRITSNSRASMREPHSGDVCIVGARRRALFKTVSLPPLAIALRFKPGEASQFLGVPASELTDRIVSVEDLWGTEGVRLREVLLLQRGPHEMLETLAAAVLERSRAAPGLSSARIARHAVGLIESAPAKRVADIAARLGVSERHLRRCFNATVGVGPKEFARMARLQRVLQASSSQTNWTQIAVDAGYFDQPHMIAEFSELVGASPRAFVARGRSLREQAEQQPAATTRAQATCWHWY